MRARGGTVILYELKFRMKRSKNTMMVFVLTLLLGATSPAQKTKVYASEDADFKTAMDLFEKEKYGAAQEYFFKTIDKIPDQNSLVRIDAEYYAAICAVELFNKDAEEMLTGFINRHPESPKIQMAFFNMARYKFRKKQYKDAAEWFEKVDKFELTKEEQAELFFKRGFAYFEEKDFEKAKKDFFEIKDIDTKYTAPALYYFSYILYDEKNYETALAGFKKLLTNESFSTIAPYYVAQILFLQKKYDEVIAYSPSLLSDTTNADRSNEIAKVVAESYYRTSQYKEAIPYFDRYRNSSALMFTSDWYEMGYCYYKAEDHVNAIDCFQKSTTGDDTLAQNSYYHLGDCYLKNKSKQLALNAFQSAYKTDIDPQITEDALFNYAKISYELSYNPFSEAIQAFSAYIEKYPNSARTDEAYKYLANVYLSSKNYEAALKSLESMKTLDAQMKSVYQTVAYFRAVQLFNDNRYSEAVKHFDKSKQYPDDKNLDVLALYWKGEAFYRIGEKNKNYDTLGLAIKAYKDFLFGQGAVSTPYFNSVNYSLGYAYFKRNEWASANASFRKFTGSKTKENEAKISDAQLRTADGFFMLKDYSNAVDYYDKALEAKTTDADYAMYQKAVVQGLLDKDEQKVKVLEQMLLSYPTSEYAAAAKYELGKTYLGLNQLDKSLACFNKVIKEHPNTYFVANSMLQVGNIQNKKKDYDAAFNTLNLVVNKYPKTEIAFQAVDILREVCKNKGDADCLNKLKDLSPNISVAQMDSDNYEIARNAYDEGNCEDARVKFQKYMQVYHDGIFIIEAYYYKAECDYKLGNLDLALGGYNYVAEQPQGKFTELSLAKSAYIYFKMQNYELANKSYTALGNIAQLPASLLDSKVGQMRCNFFLKKYDDAIVSANKVLLVEKIPAELSAEAHMTVARSAFEKQDYDLALQEFSIVSNGTQNERSAEAKYNIANIQFVKGQYKESQKTLFELINQKPAYGYWVSKAFLLLSDNYVALGDHFNAKFALKTVIEKSAVSELVDEAKMKLTVILEKEKTAEEEKKKLEDEKNKLTPESEDELLKDGTQPGEGNE